MSEGKVGDRACPRCSREFPSVEMANEHRNHCWSTGPTDDLSLDPNKLMKAIPCDPDYKLPNIKVPTNSNDHEPDKRAVDELERLKRENDRYRSIIDDMIKTYFVYGTSPTTDDVFKQARMILKDGEG